VAQRHAHNLSRVRRVPDVLARAGCVAVKIPLAEMARRKTNLRRKSVTLPPIDTTAAQAAKLASAYISIVRVWQTGARDHILRAYQRTLEQDALARDAVSDVDQAIAATEQHAVVAMLTFAKQFEQWANTTQLWHMRRFISQIKYATNIDIETMVGPADARLTIEQALARNVALVRSVNDQVRNSISDTVFRGLQARTPMRDVAREISNTTGLARDRSLRIASDQTVKLSAQLDQERQEQVGIDKFKWRHSGKVHFRPEHRARDQKIFPWDGAVARTDPPGRLPFCGCKAQGVLEFQPR
jgi:SPP1 gp7 family putative phage head morphogenesis protein